MAELNFSDAFEAEDRSADAAKVIADAAEGVLGETMREVTEPSTDLQEDRGDHAEKTEQSREENAKYAAARRKAERERDRKIREVREDAEKEMDELFADLGMVNPYTNEQIRNKADFIEWKKRFREDHLRETEVSPLPTAADDPMRHDASDERVTERVRAVVDGELQKIRQWDPKAKDLSAVTESEFFPEIYEKVKRGYSISDAYYLAKAEEQRRFAVEQAKRTGQQHKESKAHLVGTPARSGGEIHVPAEVMAEFKRLMPDASRDEIRKYYRKDKKRGH